MRSSFVSVFYVAFFFVLVSSVYALVDCGSTYAGYSGVTDYTGISWYNINQTCNATHAQSAYLDYWVFSKNATPIDDSSGNGRAFVSFGNGIIYEEAAQLYNSTGQNTVVSAANYVFNCSNWSISFKARPSSLVSAGVLIHNDYTTTASVAKGWQIRHGAGSPAQMLVCLSNFTSTDCAIDISPSASTAAGTEYVWGVTYNSSSGALRGFKNGVFMTTATRPNMNLSTAAFQLGTSSGKYNGTLDDVYLWCNAITDSEMGAWQQNATLPTSTPVYASYPFTNRSLTNGTVVVSPVGVRTCGVFRTAIDPLDDLSSLGTNNLSYRSTSNFWPVHNAATQALESYGDRVGVRSANSDFQFNETTNFSGMVDFQNFNANYQNNTGLFGKGFNWGIGINGAGDLLRYGFRNTTDTTQASISSGIVPGLARHQVTFVYNASNQNFTFYVNGTERHSTIMLITKVPTSNLPLYICDSAASTSGNSEQGNWSCFGAAIWNYTLTPTQVMDMYVNGAVASNPVGNYPFTNQTESVTCS